MCIMGVEGQLGRMILVTEDDVKVREALSSLLQHEGYEDAVAANGQEALDTLRGGLRPDIILLDMLMPVLDGWHFLERYRRDPLGTGIPIIVATAAPLTLEWARDHGCVGFLRKPIDIGRLLAEIRRCLSQAGAAD
jgi:CheY-like chemotaxis protein